MTVLMQKKTREVAAMRRDLSKVFPPYPPTLSSVENEHRHINVLLYIPILVRHLVKGLQISSI
jgi:hypothetical protein